MTSFKVLVVTDKWIYHFEEKMLLTDGNAHKFCLVIFRL